MTWVGLGGILIAALAFTSSTTYPGSAVALPVISTGFVIAGGMAQPNLGGEFLLRLPPFQWLGKLSYSLYLWHWPILIIAAQRVGHPLSVPDNLFWLCFALGLSVGSYVLIERPIRHWRFLIRSAGRSLLAGALLICLSLATASFLLASQSGSPAATKPVDSTTLPVGTLPFSLPSSSTTPTQTLTPSGSRSRPRRFGCDRGKAFSCSSSGPINCFGAE